MAVPRWEDSKPVQITPRFEDSKPVSSIPKFEESKPVSFGERIKALPGVETGLKAAKSYVSGTLPFEATKTAYKVASKIDAPIEKFRSETLPTYIAEKNPAILRTVTETGERKPVTKEQIAPVTSLAIPTVKEGVAAALLGPVIKYAAKSPLIGKIFPKIAENQLVEKEVAGLGRIQKANLVQPEFKSTELLRGVNEKIAEQTADLWKPAYKYKGGKIEQTSLKGHNMFAEKVPGRENGFIDKEGKFITLKDIQKKIEKGEAVGKYLSSANTIPDLRRKLIQEEMGKFVKDTVGDLSVPKDLEPKASGLPGLPKRSFKDDIVKQILPEEAALRKQGMHGNLLADDAMHMTQDSQIMAAKAQTKILPDLMKLPEDVRAKIPDYIEPRPGQSRPVLAGEAKVVADKVRNQLKVWGRFLENQDIEIVRNGEKSKFYAKGQFFPRSLDTELLASDANAYQDELQHLLKTKQVANVEEGKMVLDAAIKTKSNLFSPEDFVNFSGSKKVSTIERPRIYQFKNVTNDPVENLVTYFHNVSRRVNEIKYFGQHGELLRDRLAAIGNEGGDARFAEGVMKRLLKTEREDTSFDNVVRQLKAYQSITKLSLSAIPNLQQGAVNSYIRSQSESAVAKGFVKSFTKDGLDFARKAGVVGNKEVDQYMEAIAGIGEDSRSSMEKLANKVAEISFFKKSEQANRVQSANIGREYINEIAQKFLKNPEGKVGTKTLRAELESYRVDPGLLLKRGKLTINEELKAANIFTGETQFGTRPLGMPAIYNSSPVGRLMGQYSMFPIQQSRLALQAIKQHPIKTFPVVAGTSLAIGGGLNAVQDVAKGKSPIPEGKTAKEKLASYVVNSVLRSGALGKIGGAVTGASYGPESVISQIVGPTITEAGKLGYNSYQAAKGKPKQLIKQGLQQVPFVGRAASNILLTAKRKK